MLSRIAQLCGGSSGDARSEFDAKTAQLVHELNAAATSDAQLAAAAALTQLVRSDLEPTPALVRAGGVEALARVLREGDDAPAAEAAKALAAGYQSAAAFDVVRAYRTARVLASVGQRLSEALGSQQWEAVDAFVFAAAVFVAMQVAAERIAPVADALASPLADVLVAPRAPPSARHTTLAALEPMARAAPAVRAALGAREPLLGALLETWRSSAPKGAEYYAAQAPLNAGLILAHLSTAASPDAPGWDGASARAAVERAGGLRLAARLVGSRMDCAAVLRAFVEAGADGADAVARTPSAIANLAAALGTPEADSEAVRALLIRLAGSDPSGARARAVAAALLKRLRRAPLPPKIDPADPFGGAQHSAAQLLVRQLGELVRDDGDGPLGAALAAAGLAAALLRTLSANGGPHVRTAEGEWAPPGAYRVYTAYALAKLAMAGRGAHAPALAAAGAVRPLVALASEGPSEGMIPKYSLNALRALAASADEPTAREAAAAVKAAGITLPQADYYDTYIDGDVA